MKPDDAAGGVPAPAAGGAPPLAPDARLPVPDAPAAAPDAPEQGAPAPARGPARGPLAEGETVVLLDDRGRRYHVTLRRGRAFQSPRVGLLPHDRIIGQPDGVRLVSAHGVEVVCLRPTLEEALQALPRRTQILFPKDIGLLLLRGSVVPGATVLEAGIGSGALACALLRYLGPGGHLISYEVRPEFARLAQENAARFRAAFGDAGARHTVRIRDVYEGIEERDLDAVILDVPEPWRAVAAAAEGLRAGGALLAWVPTALQLYETARALQEDARFADVAVTETLLRPWDVGPRSARPAHRMVAHTGFLISARRCVPPPP